MLKYILCCFYSKRCHTTCFSTLFAMEWTEVLAQPGEEGGSLNVLWVVLQARDEILDWLTLVADLVDGCK